MDQHLAARLARNHGYDIMHITPGSYQVDRDQEGRPALIFDICVNYPTGGCYYGRAGFALTENQVKSLTE